MPRRSLLALGLATTALLAGCSSAPTASQTFPALPTAAKSTAGSAVTTGLSATQLRVVTVAREQFEHPQSATTYSQGVDEAWCADFVSWVMKTAGTPLHNPNSGGWRIPGVYTLQDYFTKAGRFHRGGSAYRPVIGDVVMYDAPNQWGNHTNLVVATSGETFTTVGGNQPGGITVTTQNVTDAGILGYGSLPRS